MNNYYTLIYLNQELNGNFLAGEFRFAISPHKDVLECYIETEEATHRLIFSARPNETALFMDRYRPPKKRNVLDFFSLLEDKSVTNVSLAKYDRLITINFEDEFRLLFKLFGNDGNVFLIRDEEIIDAFKHPETVKGQQPPEPQAPHFADDITGKAKPKNELTKLNPLLPRNLLPPLIEQHNVDEMSVNETKAFVQRITKALETDPHPRVLKNGDLTLWSPEILALSTEATFNRVNGAVRFAYRNKVHLRRLHDRKERLLQFLERAVKKNASKLVQLKQADKSLDRADEYEKYGHLLMANAHKKLEPETKEIEVDDIYKEDEQVTISLIEGMSIAKNAQRYYDKAKSSRKAYENARKRLPKVKKQKEQVELMLEEVQEIEDLSNLEEWVKEHSETLEQVGYGREEEAQTTSPFRKYKVGKYEIWIGKNAKSNDKLTTHAHKEDIWLHARGVGGSHVVIRMGNEKSYPPQNVILHAAAYAAYYSKAKGMETAPVMYTKRKYVYKPSGADPGTVVVKREQVVMVPPTKPKK